MYNNLMESRGGIFSRDEKQSSLSIHQSTVAALYFPAQCQTDGL